MAQPDYQKYLGACSDLCYESGAIGVEYSKDDSNWNIETKSDQTPVTAVDKQLNDLIVGKLSTLFPETLVVGEESADELERDLGEGLVFFVDPIDGTREFIKKNGEWAVQIGLTHDGVPVLGVVYQPTKGKMYYAIKDGGSFLVEEKGGAPRQLRGCGPVPRAMSELVVLKSKSHPDAKVDSMLEKMGVTKSMAHGSFGLKLGLMAEGKADLYFNFSGKTSMWDSTGPSVILEEAGLSFVVVEGSEAGPLRVKGTNTGHHEMLVACPKYVADEISQLTVEATKG